MKTRKKREKTEQKWARYGLNCEGRELTKDQLAAEAEPHSSAQLEAMNARQLKALLSSMGLDTKGTKVSLPHGCRATKSDGCRNGRGA